MDVLAVWLGKVTAVLLRVSGRRATALPGLVVEKVFPSYLPRQLRRLPHGVIVISGTNGKTTTTKMVASVLGLRYRVLTNATGGNFVRGTLTATLAAATWSGRLAADVAVFELDEAHAVKFCALHAPRRVLLLNVLRDQLDRFGEIDITAKLLASVAATATEHLVLNRDDPRLAALGASSSVAVSYFGVAPSMLSMFPTDEQLYDDKYGPVGTDHPPEAGQAAECELLDVEADPDGGTRLRCLLQGRTVQLRLRTEGVHNAQNAVAAAAVALTLGIDGAAITEGLSAVEPAFGRGQTFQVRGRKVVLQLVKNPAGFRLSLRTVATLHPAATVIAINDDYADGRDMSWLWDVDFTVLAGDGDSGTPVNRLITAGSRAADMALRLHYDELAVDCVEPGLVASVASALDSTPPAATVVVFATYTAMWELHRLLERAEPGLFERAATTPTQPVPR